MHRFAVIGLGRFGQRLARALAEAGAEVLAIDRRPRPVEEIRDAVALAVCLDSSDEEALRSQPVAELDAAIVGIGEDFESAVLTVATLKQLGVPRIIARAETDLQARILSAVGATEIASPDTEAATRWAHRLMLPDLTQYIELGEGYSLVNIPAPSAFVGSTLRRLELRRRYGINVVAIERQVTVQHAPESEPTQARQMMVPLPDTMIEPGDRLVLVGSDEHLASLPRD